MTNEEFAGFCLTGFGQPVLIRQDSLIVAAWRLAKQNKNANGPRISAKSGVVDCDCADERRQEDKQTSI